MFESYAIKMWRKRIVCVIFSIVFIAVHGHEFKNFDDTVLFKVNWPGQLNKELAAPKIEGEPYFITSANKEKYQCFIPDTTVQKQENTEPYVGPNPMRMLSLLFNQNACTHKPDIYWTYELCHGRYVRQFHEDRDGKKTKIQEYYLGTIDIPEKQRILKEYEEREKNPNRKAEIPVKKIDGLNMPYVEIEMGHGTVCDLNNKRRKIKVLYVCYQHGKHDILSVKETSSCEYEAIVLSPYLCVHPDYKPQDTGENEINCLPVDNAPQKPKALYEMELESSKLMHQKSPDDNQQKVYAIFHVNKEGQDGEARVRVKIHPRYVIDKHYNSDDSISSLIDQDISPAELSSVKNFFSGRNCLHGGNGWWKYEFCYGRSVVQYHVEHDGMKTTVNLGNFDKQKHLEWIATHPHKKPKSLESRTHISHFYSDGTICDKTGAPRQTEVTLKCVESHIAGPSNVSLFLHEPKTCEYVLRVESPLICEIVEYADENGLLSEEFEVNFDKLKTTAFHVEQNESDERIANEDD